MPVTVIMTSVKPAEVEFFSTSSPENAEINQTIHNWTMEQPGVISHNLVDSDNTRVVTMVFDTVENYANWAANRHQVPNQNIRNTYNTTNNIVTTIHETLT